MSIIVCCKNCNNEILLIADNEYYKIENKIIKQRIYKINEYSPVIKKKTKPTKTNAKIVKMTTDEINKKLDIICYCDYCVSATNDNYESDNDNYNYDEPDYYSLPGEKKFSSV